MVSGNATIALGSQALTQLRKAVENAFCAAAHPGTLSKIQEYGLKVEDVERVVGAVLVDYLPGGPSARGGEFVISALSLYQGLTQEEREDFRTFYEDAVTQNKWKVVPPAVFTGPAPAANPANAFSVGARYVVHLQSGGFKRTVFVDVSELKLQERRRQILEQRPDSAPEMVSREMQVVVGTFVQQRIEARIFIAPNEVLMWN
jgi:hypothetical protein